MSQENSVTELWHGFLKNFRWLKHDKHQWPSSTFSLVKFVISILAGTPTRRGPARPRLLTLPSPSPLSDRKVPNVFSGVTSCIQVAALKFPAQLLKGNNRSHSAHAKFTEKNWKVQGNKSKQELGKGKLEIRLKPNLFSEGFSADLRFCFERGHKIQTFPNTMLCSCCFIAVSTFAHVQTIDRCADRYTINSV